MICLIDKKFVNPYIDNYNKSIHCDGFELSIDTEHIILQIPKLKQNYKIMTFDSFDEITQMVKLSSYASVSTNFKYIISIHIELIMWLFDVNKLQSDIPITI